MPLTGVAGWPIGHSRSPALHSAAFEALGLEGWESQLLPIPPDLFEETVRALPESGFAGINVTIPHKESALSIADDVSEQARLVGAANTLTFRQGRIEAANTDVPAIAAAIGQRLGDDTPATALVLGAGGSARAAVHALGLVGVGRVGIWNRSADRARRLVADLGAGEAVVEVGEADILVNCTSAGLVGDPATAFADLPVDAGGMDAFPTVVDLVYREGGAPITVAALRAGCQVVDGLEILVRQGALSVGMWCGAEPPLEPLVRAVAD